MNLIHGPNRNDDTEGQPIVRVNSNFSVSTPVLFVGVFVLCLTGLFLFDLYQEKTEEALQADILEQKEIVESLAKPWSEQERDSRQEDLNKFIAEVDVQISDPSIDIDTKKRLLLSKAMALGSVRSLGVQYDGILEAANILNSLYSTETTNTDSDKFKYATIPFYIGMLHSTCYYPGLAQALPSPYSDQYKEYVEIEGLPEKQAVLLAFDSFADEGRDPRYERDAAASMNHAYILALYFYAYGTQVRPVELDPASNEVVLWNKLATLLETNIKPILITGVNRSVIDPAFRYAFAYDISKTYTNYAITDELNAQIDANYEKVFTLIDENEEQSDETSVAVASILNAIFYLESMHRRYDAGQLDAERVQEVINIFMDNVSLNTDTRELYSGYFLEGATEEGKWMPVRAGFMNLVPQYPELKAFFSDSFGVDL